MEWPRGGVNSIPLTCPRTSNDELVISDIVIDKRAVFDWISFTFDDLDTEYFFDIQSRMRSDINIQKKNDTIINTILQLLGSDKSDWKQHAIEDCSINGFKYVIVIGESIMINLYGPKSSRGRPITQLLMRGDGCREFVEYQNGDWVKLFSYLNSLHGQYKRIDLAIDDFCASEIDIYDLEKFARNGYWTGDFQCMKIISDVSFRGGTFSKGFSMTFGSDGSTQLQIYDKNLERKSKNAETFCASKWYRYEMRLVDDKAMRCISEFLNSMSNDGKGESFMLFASSMLSSLIEFKEKPEGNDDRIRRWPILSAWSAFLGSIKNIKLRGQKNTELTLDRKLKWYNRSIATTNALFYLADPDTYLQGHLHELGKACFLLSASQICAVNKKRNELGLASITAEEISDIGKKQVLFPVAKL